MDSAAGIDRKESGSRATKSFVLRSGRMSPAQKRSYENLFPLYAIKGDDKGIIDCSSFFGNAGPLHIEIGFGMGRATAGIALNNPENSYLGIEVHRPGIGRLLWDIEKLGIKNIRVIEGDAAKILADRIQDNSISAFHIFFPDPWPKKRHHKRRLIKRPFTDLLAAKLLPGGYIYMVSDWVEYGEWALAELGATAGLANKYTAFSEPQQWRPETEFEKKGRLKNHEIRELFFVKI
jgi:tRNA (guanine-N7-)-methyltransferase